MQALTVGEQAYIYIWFFILFLFCCCLLLCQWSPICGIEFTLCVCVCVCCFLFFARRSKRIIQFIPNRYKLLWTFLFLFGLLKYCYTRQITKLLYDFITNPDNKCAHIKCHQQQIKNREKQSKRRGRRCSFVRVLAFRM